LKSGSLNLLEPSGPVQACNGAALPFTGIQYQVEKHKVTQDVSDETVTGYSALFCHAEKQKRYCTYNVKLRRFRITTLAVEKQ
jgi:uncharacterized protein YhbP (UPF0306 family)